MAIIYNNINMLNKFIYMYVYNLYFILHTSFFYSLGVTIYLNNFNGWMLSIILVKFLDMAFKINMMQKLNSGQSLEEVMPINIKIKVGDNMLVNAIEILNNAKQGKYAIPQLNINNLDIAYQKKFG